MGGVTTSSLVAKAVKMSAEEARRHVDRINGHVSTARALILEFYEREGWKPLGYSSWRQCILAEFTESQRTLYRMLEAGKIERDICQGGVIGEIPESVLKPLKSVPEDHRAAVWEEARELADGKTLTSEIVQTAVEDLFDSLPPAAKLEYVKREEQRVLNNAQQAGVKHSRKSVLEKISMHASVIAKLSKKTDKGLARKIEGLAGKISELVK